MTPRLAIALFAAVGCGTPPAPRDPEPSAVVPDRASPPSDPCRPGDIVPTSGGKPFSGLARQARCREELIDIMQATASALGVTCKHCHLDDFAAPTRNKDVANWMATKFAPSLKRRDGGVPTCADCHTDAGKARAKILGHPRRHDMSVEWMTTVLVERFETQTGEPLYCRTCHVAGLGESGFVRQVILSDHLPQRFYPDLPPDG